MNLLEQAQEIDINEWCSLSNAEYINQSRQDELGCYWVVYKTTEGQLVKIHMFS